MKEDYISGWHHSKVLGQIQQVKVSNQENLYLDAIIWEEYVSTGKQQVYAGYRKVIEIEGNEICSKIQSSRYEALRNVAQKLHEIKGYQLHVWGLDDEFYSTGMSEGDGKGYIRSPRGQNDRLITLISPKLVDK